MTKVDVNFLHTLVIRFIFFALGLLPTPYVLFLSLYSFRLLTANS